MSKLTKKQKRQKRQKRERRNARRAKIHRLMIQESKKEPQPWVPVKMKFFRMPELIPPEIPSVVLQ